jgi:hypothetical protein|nr:hypothetical protein [Kofleriaceae bacterium]
MKSGIIGATLAVALAAAAGPAHADAFGFTDHAGFVACMQLDHLVESVKLGDRVETRVLGPDEIQPRCVATAAALVTRTKDSALGLASTKSTVQLATAALALPLASATIDVSLPACNDGDLYSALLQPLSDGYTTNLPAATPIIKRCLKNKDFKTDFLDELKSGDDVRAGNACRIARDEKLVKSCKGAP